MTDSYHEVELSLPLEWIVPPNIVSQYATNLVVQYTGNEFIISFFEVHPPILLGTQEEVEAKLEKIDSVKAECIARIIVSADRMPVFLRALTNNVQKHLENSENVGEQE